MLGRGKLQIIGDQLRNEGRFLFPASNYNCVPIRKIIDQVAALQAFWYGLLADVKNVVGLTQHLNLTRGRRLSAFRVLLSISMLCISLKSSLYRGQQACYTAYRPSNCLVIGLLAPIRMAVLIRAFSLYRNVYQRSQGFLGSIPSDNVQQLGLYLNSGINHLGKFLR